MGCGKLFAAELHRRKGVFMKSLRRRMEGSGIHPCIDYGGARYRDTSCCADWYRTFAQIAAEPDRKRYERNLA